MPGSHAGPRRIWPNISVLKQPGRQPMPVSIATAATALLPSTTSSENSVKHVCTRQRPSIITWCWRTLGSMCWVCHGPTELRNQALGNLTPSRTKPDIPTSGLAFCTTIVPPVHHGKSDNQHQNTRSLLVLSSPMPGFVGLFQTDSGCGPLGLQGMVAIPARDFLCSQSQLSKEILGKPA